MQVVIAPLPCSDSGNATRTRGPRAVRLNTLLRSTRGSDRREAYEDWEKPSESPFGLGRFCWIRGLQRV